MEKESTRCPKMAVRPCPNIAFPSPTTTIITNKLPQTTRLSAMISTLQINVTLRRAFKDRYQKRETKARAALKGEPVQGSVSIMTGKTSKRQYRSTLSESDLSNSGSQETSPEPREKGIQRWYARQSLTTAFLSNRLLLSRPGAFPGDRL